MTRQEFETMQVPVIRELVEMKISDDEEAKAAGEAKAVGCTFILEGWTGRDILNALFGASSLRVRFQNAHRGKKVIPVEWKASRPGSSGTSTTTPYAALVALLGQERAIKMVNKLGTVEAALEAVQAMLDDADGGE